MKSLLILIVAAACLFVATRLATVWLLSEAGQPVQADLLVVLSGGSSERTETALGLFRRGLAPRILITDPEGFPDPAFRWLEKQGVPHRALLAPMRPAASTLEDASCIREAAMRDGLKSVLVVTSPYHCRRARAILDARPGATGDQGDGCGLGQLLYGRSAVVEVGAGLASGARRAGQADLVAPDGQPPGGLGRPETGGPTSRKCLTLQ
jgi:hypothetical protein